MRTETPAFTGVRNPGPLTAIKTVIFDCGRVLTCDQDTECAQAMADTMGAGLEEFRAVYTAQRHEYDRGTESARQYWDRVAANWGRRLDDAGLERMVNLDMDSWFTINPAIVALVAELKARGYGLLILSNMNLEGKLRLLGPARFLDGKDWLSNFDDVLLSCDLKLLKPERRIYEVCLERARTPAEACLFIDDIEVNVLAARALGMHALVFTNVPHLRKTIERDYRLG